MSETKRVLYTAFDTVPNPKGASTHITYFLRGLVDNGYDVTCLTTTDGCLPESELYAGAHMLRVRIPAGQTFSAGTRLFAKAVAAELHRHSYDLVHFRSLWDFPAIANYRKQAKLLFEVNGLPSVELRYHYPALRGTDLISRLRDQELKALAAANAIICPSGVTKTFLSSLDAPASRITVIPNGVDLSLFSPAEEPNAGPPLIFYAGTFIEWQGLDTLVEALPYISDRCIRLELVGKPSRGWLKRLQKKIAKLDLSERVVIREPLGYYSMASAIRQASICVAPLAYCDRNVVQGCCPIKILEYFACRKPVVAANLPVVREVLRDGVEGLLFDPNDPAELARRLQELLESPELAGRLADNGYRRVAKEFTWEVAQNRLLEVYRALLREE